MSLENFCQVMRHARSVPNTKDLIVSHIDQGRLATNGLSFAGTKQVRESVFRSDLSSGVQIISSDFSRALETAQLVKEVAMIQPEIKIDERLRERFFGEFDGQSPASKFYPQVWAKDLFDPNHTEWGVASVMSIVSKTNALLADLKVKYGRRKQKILLVTHGDVAQIMMAVQQGMGPNMHRSLKPLETAEIRPLMG